MDDIPRNLRAMLAEVKDLSELMVDLAYAALYFGDPDMAEEVGALEERMDALVHDMRSVCVMAARTPREADAMASVLQVISAIERIANAAVDIARIVTHRLGIPRELVADLSNAEEVSHRVRVRDGSHLARRPLADLELPVQTGMRIVAIRPSDGQVLGEVAINQDVPNASASYGYSETSAPICANGRLVLGAQPTGQRPAPDPERLDAGSAVTLVAAALAGWKPRGLAGECHASGDTVRPPVRLAHVANRVHAAAGRPVVKGRVNASGCQGVPPGGGSPQGAGIGPARRWTGGGSGPRRAPGAAATHRGRPPRGPGLPTGSGRRPAPLAPPSPIPPRSGAGAGVPCAS